MILDLIIGMGGVAVGGFAIGYGVRALTEGMYHNRLLRCVECGKQLKDCDDPITHGIRR
jgi:hypothetical protein